MPKEKQSSLNSFFSKKRTLSENPSTSSASSSSPEEILEPPAKSPTITSAGLKDLPSEILVQIFQYLTVQDCLRGVGRVCRRFQGLIEYTGEVWRTLETDVELSTEAFQSIMRHAKLIRKLGLRFSQKRLRYASPDMYIESYLACCVNVCWLDLSYNTSIISLAFLHSMHSLEYLNLHGCTSIDPINMMTCLNGCQALRAIDITNCIQFEENHIPSLIDTFRVLTCLKMIRAFDINVSLTVENVRVILQTAKNIETFAITPAWDPRDDNCGEANPVSDVPYDVSHVVKSAEKLSDAERVQFLENCWRPTPSCSNLDTQYWKSGNLNKHIKFQIKWLDQRKWLAYSARPDHIGAWCITCCLFLSDNEKASLGSFVKTPFRTYNKSKEKFDGHETKEYHKKAVERSYVVRAQVSNIQKRIDTQIDSVRMDNIQSNKTVLPLIVDAVMLCAKQQIALSGHRDYNIDFAEAPAQNEGNFIAILRLLAESNPELKRHLISGPANARYTSKTVQNEIISVMADLIRDYFRQCLEETPHFALIADETTSEGREVLSVCLRLLDFADPTNPIQREVLLDL
ncbi:unnamed protein product [Porites lobata]|uniref:F-box domain-containing protein n=1 Tax=Porites lobata TaxID=104759 RepID=A0ABN8Q9M7_9CNID|nr:unnamed protein product [Porites lobata]